MIKTGFPYVESPGMSKIPSKCLQKCDFTKTLFYTSWKDYWACQQIKYRPINSVLSLLGAIENWPQTVLVWNLVTVGVVVSGVVVLVVGFGKGVCVAGLLGVDFGVCLGVISVDVFVAVAMPMQHKSTNKQIHKTILD